MDADQPGLFQLPDREPQVTPERPQRGRNREVWGLSATAEVTITNASAVQAAARANEGFVITVPGVDLGVKDAEPEAPDAAPGDDVFDALAWLIWPSDGLEGRSTPGPCGSCRWRARPRATPSITGRPPGGSRPSSLTWTRCAGWPLGPPRTRQRRSRPAWR